MNILEHKTDTLSLVTIEGKSDLVQVRLSVDLHTKTTAHTRVVGEVYAHMLLAGSASMSRLELLDTFNKIGTRVTVRYHEGRLELAYSIHTRHHKDGLSLLTRVLQEPHFTTKELRRIRSVIQNELDQYREMARGRAHDALCNALYDKKDRRAVPSLSALGRAIQAVGLSDVRALHNKLMETPWKLTVAGSKQEISHTVHALSSIQERTSTTQPYHRQVALSSATLDLISVPSKSNIEFSIGGPLPITCAHPDFPAFHFGMAVLGKWGGFTGRLMSTVREREGLTYSIYAKIDTATTNELGYWRIMTFFDPARAKQGLSSTLREIKHIVADGITVKELTRFKTILATQERLLADSITQTLNQRHQLHIASVSGAQYRSMQERIQTLSKQDVDTVLQTYLDPTRLVVCGAGPVSGMQKNLEKVIK